METKVRRRCLQFNMRTLLVALLVAALPLGWVAHQRRQIAERRQTLAMLGASLYGLDAQPAWRVWLLGDDSPQYARRLVAYGKQITDADVVYLKGLTQLEYLSLGETPITNAGLMHLAGLTNLQQLFLDRTQLTDAGLVHLQALALLQMLDLAGTKVTDAGLERLGRLKQLRRVYLFRTQVTDAGIAELKQVLPNCHIVH